MIVWHGLEAIWMMLCGAAASTTVRAADQASPVPQHDSTDERKAA